MSKAAAAKKLCILLIGAPGAGKGTVVGRILKNFDVKHFATGDLLRAHVRNKTDLGKQVADTLKRGDLLPSSIVNSLMFSELNAVKVENPNAPCHILLDGFPRKTSQAEAFEKHQPGVLTMRSVLYLNIPFPIIVDRLSKRWTHLPSGRVYNDDFNPPKVRGKDDETGEALVQRDDDKPETVLRRLKMFEKETAPVLQFYRQRGLVSEFAGETTNQIWPHILTHLKQIMPKHRA